MAQRRPLGKISGNRPKGHELTVNEQAQIVGVIKCGVKIVDVSKTLNFNSITVIATVQRDLIQQVNKSLSCSGRSKKADDRDICTIVQYVQINSKHTY